jgi:hypothetical protein
VSAIRSLYSALVEPLVDINTHPQIEDNAALKLYCWHTKL